MNYKNLKTKKQIRSNLLPSAATKRRKKKSYSIFRGGSIKKTTSEIGPSSGAVALREPPLKMDLQRRFSLVNRP